MKLIQGLSSIVLALGISYGANAYASPNTDINPHPQKTTLSIEGICSSYRERANAFFEDAQYKPGISISERTELFQQSINEFNVIFEIDGCNLTPKIITERTDVLIEVGKYEEAKKDLSFVLKKNPEYPKAHRLLGRILREEGNLKDAEREQRKALQLDATDPYNYTSLAFTLYSKDDKSVEAENLYMQVLNMQEAKKKVPKDATYAALVVLGKIYNSRGDIESAKEKFEAAKKFDESRPDAYSAMGKMKMELGDKTAIEEFRQAAKLYPHEHFYSLLKTAEEKFQIERFK